MVAGSGRFCSHCGTALPDAPRITPDEYRTHAERYRAVRAHERYPAAMDHTPPLPSTAPAVLALTVMLFVGVGITAYLAVRVAGTGVPSFLPLLLGLVWAGTIGHRIVELLNLAHASVVRVVAVVVDERIKVSGGGKNSSATTTYYATLQTEDGGRVELTTSDNVAGMIARGDIGVAYTRAGTLLELERFPV